jgi:hypothetical protein
MTMIRSGAGVFAIFITLGVVWGADEPAKKPVASLKEDHRSLQGTWDRPPTKDKEGLIIVGWRLVFKGNRLGISHYIKESEVLMNMEEGSFELKEVGKKRVIYKSGDGVLTPSSTPYTLKGDKLILAAEKGALKGEWKRIKEKK